MDRAIKEALRAAERQLLKSEKGSKTERLLKKLIVELTNTNFIVF